MMMHGVDGAIVVRQVRRSRRRGRMNEVHRSASASNSGMKTNSQRVVDCDFCFVLFGEAFKVQ